MDPYLKEACHLLGVDRLDGKATFLVTSVASLLQRRWQLTVSQVRARSHSRARSRSRFERGSIFFGPDVAFAAFVENPAPK